MKRILCLSMVAVLLLSGPLALAQPSRLALVMGNAKYRFTKSLENPVNDATDMQAVLKALGFDVNLVTNIDRRGMEAAIRDFGNRLRTQQGVGVFYFAGHGVQYENVNYLVPVDAEIQSEVDMKYQAVAADYVVEQMQKANTGTNIIIFDACRDNPFQQFSRGGARGLAAMAPKGVFVAFATSPGDTAADGAGRNGTFTKHLLNALRTEPQLSIADLFIDVTANVDAETGGKQVPWQHVSMTRRFCFADCGRESTPTPSQADSGLTGKPTPAPSQEGKPTPPKNPTPTPLPDGEGPGVGLPPTNPPAGTVWYDAVVDMNFVWAPAGAFQMGCGPQDGDCDSDGKPAYRVTLDGFWIGQTEVTQAQWQRIMGNNPSKFKGENNPVEEVSWEDAQEFLRKLNGQVETGRRPVSTGVYRLPTEAEWEYAGRAGTQTAYNFGNDAGKLGDYAWYDENSGGQTHPVGQKQPSPWNLYDIHGNVWEWCADWYGAYSATPQMNPRGHSEGSDRVLRGGCWLNGPRGVRSADRRRYPLAVRNDDVGLRLVRTK